MRDDVLLLPVAVFVAILVGHATWTAQMPAPACDGTACVKDAQGNCPTAPGQPGDGAATGLLGYLQRGDVYMGFSYALALAFAAHSLAQLRRKGRRAVVGAAGGLGIGAILLAAGCFLVGCCGSPMLVVWIGLFGAKATGVAKPVIAAVTLASVTACALYMRKGCGPGCCSCVPAEDEAGKA